MNDRIDLIDLLPPTNPEDLALLRELESLLKQPQVGLKLTTESGREVNLPVSLHRAIEQVIHYIIANRNITIVAEIDGGKMSSNLDVLSEFFQDEGFYDDDFIDRYMAESEA